MIFDRGNLFGRENKFDSPAEESRDIKVLSIENRGLALVKATTLVGVEFEHSLSLVVGCG